MGHAWQLYISNLVMKLRGNGRFWRLDKKILAAGCALRAYGFPAAAGFDAKRCGAAWEGRSFALLRMTRL
jgi:hypothetical protein